MAHQEIASVRRYRGDFQAVSARVTGKLWNPRTKERGRGGDKTGHSEQL